MPAYLVLASQELGIPRQEGVDTMIVFAADASTAKKIAGSKHGSDSNAAWTAATVTQIVAGVDLSGWKLHIKLVHPTTGAVVVDVTVTGTDSDNTVDKIAALAVIALNATAPIAASAYNSTSQVLKIAETTDALGDHLAYVELLPPATSYENPLNISDMIGTITSGGSSGAAVTVALPADAVVVPTVALVCVRK